MAAGEDETVSTATPRQFTSLRFELPSGMTVAFDDVTSSSWDEAEAKVVARYAEAEPLVELAKEIADKFGRSAVDVLKRAHDIARFEQDRADRAQKQ